MRRCFTLVPIIAVLMISHLPAGNPQSPESTSWPSFRGHRARGVAEGFATPASWSVPDKSNVLWRVSVPGLAHSSPIIWGNSIFLTTAVSEGENEELRVGLYGDITPVNDDSVQSFQLLRLERSTGKTIWTKTAHRGVPRIKRHPKATHANPSPATDGRRVVAFFGSEGLYCFDFEGNLLWQKDLGTLNSAFFVAPEAQWGFASSPVVFDGKVFVQCDVLGDSFVAAFDLNDGRELWRTRREDVPTWSTPTVHQGAGTTQLILNGWKHIGGYDAGSGKELWKLTGGGDIPVPTPVVAGDLVYVTNAHGRAAPIYAIRLDARGDISLGEGATSNESIAWSVQRGGAYMQTPLVYGDYLYNCRDNGVLSCYEAKTGKQMYQERLGQGSGGFSASPVAADGKLYFSSETGDVYVVRAGPSFEVVGVNSFDEVLMATPAISEGTLYFRTRSHLTAIAE